MEGKFDQNIRMYKKILKQQTWKILPAEKKFIGEV